MKSHLLNIVCVCLFSASDIENFKTHRAQLMETLKIEEMEKLRVS